MTAVRVFDPAMCCSTGVCGASVDPRLARFSADLGWLKSHGVAVDRFNLAQQPGAFAGHPAVKAALEATGEAGLPLIEVDGEIKSRGVYPSRAELAAWAGVPAPPDPAADASSRLCCAPSKAALATPDKPGCC